MRKNVQTDMRDGPEARNSLYTFVLHEKYRILRIIGFHQAIINALSADEGRRGTS